MHHSSHKITARCLPWLVILTAACSVNSAAQETAAQQTLGPNAQPVIEEIVVTGSRLAKTDLTSTSPITVLGDEEINSRGISRIEDLVNTLPQALAGQSAFSGINAGIATVNLRGLGAERTLVLIDGKRLPFGSPTKVAADLNQIPAQLIEQVEVLTGGASAVYGADAIAGVVNFRLKRDFQGLDAKLQGGFFNDAVAATPSCCA